MGTGHSTEHVVGTPLMNPQNNTMLWVLLLTCITDEDI